MSLAERIGVKTAQSLARTLDSEVLPMLWVCMDQLKKVKRDLEVIARKT